MGGKGVDYWNSVGDSWSRQRQKLWRAHSDAVNCALIARWLPQGAAGRVLKTDLFDEMCSEGLYPLLAPLGPLFVGIDLSGKTLRAARARHQDIQAVAADVLTLPFAEGTFDLIISTSTLDHFESPAAIADSLAELFRVLRPGGRMIITMDKDFGELVYNSGMQHAGVLILRLDDADSDTKIEVLKKILTEYCDKIESHFCVFQDGRLRIRG